MVALLLALDFRELSAFWKQSLLTYRPGSVIAGTKILQDKCLRFIEYIVHFGQAEVRNRPFHPIIWCNGGIIRQ